MEVYFKYMKILNRIFFTLTIVWMIVIFILSAQTGDDSANLSGGITKAIISFIYRDFDSFSPDKQLSILDTAHFVIRKLAHFTEYVILGIFSSLTFITNICANQSKFNSKSFRNHMFRTMLFSYVFSTLYAVTDEIHQGFTDNRYPSIKDVLIDSSGALFGVIIACIIFYYFHIKKVIKANS